MADDEAAAPGTPAGGAADGAPGGQGEAEGRALKGNWKAAEGKTGEAWGKPADEEPQDGRDARMERTRERYGQTHDAEGRGHPEDEPLSDG